MLTLEKLSEKKDEKKTQKFVRIRHIFIKQEHQLSN